jgi:putative transposase
MTNHIHLIIDPGAEEHNLSMLMKRIAGGQTRYVNKMEHRSGTLWEGRYKSSPISTNDYLLACCRYDELNPVRAGIVAKPEAYPSGQAVFDTITLRCMRLNNLLYSTPIFKYK